MMAHIWIVYDKRLEVVDSVHKTREQARKVLRNLKKWGMAHHVIEKWVLNSEGEYECIEEW